MLSCSIRETRETAADTASTASTSAASVSSASTASSSSPASSPPTNLRGGRVGGVSGDGLSRGSPGFPGSLGVPGSFTSDLETDVRSDLRSGMGIRDISGGLSQASAGLACGGPVRGSSPTGSIRVDFGTLVLGASRSRFLLLSNPTSLPICFKSIQLKGLPAKVVRVTLDGVEGDAVHEGAVAMGDSLLYSASAAAASFSLLSSSSSSSFFPSPPSSSSSDSSSASSYREASASTHPASRPGTRPGGAVPLLLLAPGGIARLHLHLNTSGRATPEAKNGTLTLLTEQQKLKVDIGYVSLQVRSYEQALVCRSNREIVDASRGCTFHC